MSGCWKGAQYFNSLFRDGEVIWSTQVNQGNLTPRYGSFPAQRPSPRLIAITSPDLAAIAPVDAQFYVPAMSHLRKVALDPAKLVFEGIVTVKPGVSYKRRVMRFYEDESLCIFKSSSDPFPCTHIPLRGCASRFLTQYDTRCLRCNTDVCSEGAVRTLQESKVIGIHVTKPGGSTKRIFFRTEADKDEWISIIGQCKQKLP